MKAKRNGGKGNMAARAAAAAARAVARDSTMSACMFFIHQPKEPADMAARLNTISERARKGS